MDKIREAIKKLLDLKDLPDGEELSGFSAEQLAEAADKAKEAFAEAKESRDLSAATEARDVFKAIEVENATRENAQAVLDTELAKLESDLEVKDEADEEEEEEKVEDKKDDKDEESAEEEDSKVEAKSEEKADEKAEETPAADVKAEVHDAPDIDEITKEVTKRIAASAKRPVPKPSGKPKPAKPVAVITASGDADGFQPGGSISITEMSEAWVNKATALSQMAAPGKQARVANISGISNGDRLLDPRNPADANSEIINKYVEEVQARTRETLRQMTATQDVYELEALTAAGGLCAPLEPRYDIFSIGDDGRPLANSLPSFNAKRGGIRYIDADTVPYMSDTDGALGHFTEEQDTTGDDYPKPCLRVDCPTWEEVFVEADTVCMIVGMWQQLTFPENFRAWWRMAQVNRARQMETRLWDKLVALTTAVTAGEGLGATSDVLTQVERAATQMRWRYRIAAGTSLRLWVPTWLFSIMRTDLARRQPGDGLGVLSVSDAELARHFAARNIAVTQVIDGQSPGGTSGDIQAAGALNPWPSTVEVILAIEGTFIFLEMNGLNFGTEIRDFDMIRNNDVGAFFETFENVARVGTQALSITLNVCPDGTTAGVDADFDPCVSGS